MTPAGLLHRGGRRATQGKELRIVATAMLMTILTMARAAASDTLPLQFEITSESGTKIDPQGEPLLYSAKRDQPTRWHVRVAVARPEADTAATEEKTEEKKIKRIVLQLGGPLARYAKIEGAESGDGEGAFVISGASAAQVVVEISAVTDELAQKIDEAGGGIELSGFAELETEDTDEDDLDGLIEKAIEALTQARNAVSAAGTSLAAKDSLDPQLREIAAQCATLDALERTINENVTKVKENAAQSIRVFNAALGKAKACGSREDLAAASAEFNTAFGYARVASESYRAVETGVNRFRSTVQSAAQAVSLDPKNAGGSQSPEQRLAAFDTSIKEARESEQKAKTLLDRIERLAPPEGAEQIASGRKDIEDVGKDIEELVKKREKQTQKPPAADAAEPPERRGAADANQQAPTQLCQDRKVPEAALNDAALAMQNLGLETITDLKAGAQFGDSFYAAESACQKTLDATAPKWFLVTHVLEGRAHYENRRCAGKRFRVIFGREDAEGYKRATEEENQRCKKSPCEIGALYSRLWTANSWTITIEPHVEKPEQPKDEWQCGEPGSGG